MNWPLLRSRLIGCGNILHVNDNGNFFVSDPSFSERLLAHSLSTEQTNFLKLQGHILDDQDEFSRAAHLYNVAHRWTQAKQIDYLILVPTLRCNLNCSYCQVSRVAEQAKGFDWDDATLQSVLTFIDNLSSESIKVEFQGGEPTLRPDLIRAVIDRCQRFANRQFVICTNLQVIDDVHWELFDNPELYISTSLDGTMAKHSMQRTGDGTPDFRTNLEAVLSRYGPEKISALPTIDPSSPPDIDETITTYADLGLNSIFLRPINYQGFARKRHKHSRNLDQNWITYHREFVERLIERNWRDRTRVLEEAYFSVCLRRVFQPDADRHVDLRNPNPLAVDYIVVDFDGTIYPTDEARMLARSGIIDLSLGQIGQDWRNDKWRTLNDHCSNLSDPACQRCAYQPFCGRDVVDDLARYGTIDLLRTETVFCQRQLAVFDFVFDLLYRDDPKVRYSLSRWLRMDGIASSFGERI